MSSNCVISGFDILKFLMAFIIVNIHAGLKKCVEGTPFHVVWSYFNSVAVPAFFVLSSYFLFKKMRLLNDANRGGYFVALRKTIA